MRKWPVLVVVVVVVGGGVYEAFTSDGSSFVVSV
jgi:hypothetical protein